MQRALHASGLALQGRVGRSAAASSALAGVIAHSSAAAPPALGISNSNISSVRTYATVTRRRRKEMAKEKASEMRSLLAFAQRYDHMRTAKLELAQTLKRLGWPFLSGEQISDGLTADFTMREHYCAFTIVDGSHYVLPGSENASSQPGMPPLPRDGQGQVLMPHESPYPSAPPPWANPVLGLVLDKQTAAQHDTIRSKGWSLVAIPLPLWRLARAMPSQHYARRDLVMSLTLPLAPFELRPVSVSGPAGGASAGGGKAK